MRCMWTSSFAAVRLLCFIKQWMILCTVKEKKNIFTTILHGKVNFFSLSLHVIQSSFFCFLFPFLFFSLPHLFIFKTLSLSFSCLFKQHHRMNLIKNPIWVLFLKPRKQTPLKMAEVASNCLFLFFLQLLTLCASGKQLVSTLSWSCFFSIFFTRLKGEKMEPS